MARPSDEGRRRYSTRSKPVVNMGRAGSCFTFSRAGVVLQFLELSRPKNFWDLKFVVIT